MLRRAVLVSLLAAALAAAATAPSDTPVVPRKSPDLSIPLPAGGQVDLAQYRGKVVVIQFLLTTCPHCQHASELLSKLQGEYGPKGVQILGVSFDPMPRLVVPDYVKDHNVSFPIGYLQREQVYKYLGADQNDAIHVPQLVFIDRKGVIQKQSLYRGDAETATEPNIRKVLDQLTAAAPAPRRR